VLPFENLSGIPENAYFAEGIQEEILTRLAKIADLKVIPRTSTTRYRSSPDNLRDIAKQLGVTNILEGSVQRTTDQVHVNVQLIKAASDAIPDIALVELDALLAQQLADQLSLGNSSRQRSDNVNVINNTPDTREFGTEVAADRGQISMHSRSNVGFQPGLAILGAKDDVQDDFTERLRHCANDDRNCAGSESRFQRWRCGVRRILGRCPRLV
jgi:TolB-like protein